MEKKYSNSLNIKSDIGTLGWQISLLQNDLVCFLKETSLLSNSLSHLICCRFLNDTGRHHTFHEAKQLW